MFDRIQNVCACVHIRTFSQNLREFSVKEILIFFKYKNKFIGLLLWDKYEKINLRFQKTDK
jgi:hypothetical protein